MGAYLSEPVTEKVSSDESGRHLSYGAASMQGWRINQEDAHNCIVKYDEHDTSFFAVYDGHGGAEVAKYCAMKLPDFIRALPSYKEGRLDEALSEGFLKFDATLLTPEVLAELKLMAGNTSDGEASEGDGEDSPEEDEAEMLSAEANMPIEEILERYGAKTKKQDGEAEDAKKEGTKEEGAKMVNGECTGGTAAKVENGEEPETKEEADTKPSADAPEDSGEGSSGSGSKRAPRRTPKPYEALVKDEEISDSSEDSDESSQEEAEEEDDDEDEEEEDEDEEKEESDEDGSCLSLNMLRRSLARQDAMSSINVEAAGYDSGCTAVVGIVKGRRLVVANAGDSRCVVCRSGKAVDMSVDHKPEDAVELARIKNAGGNVEEGRVNGGLNLSRAIGDHSYKCNRDLEAKDQMITALPDIRTLDIDPETDKFMVLACDGIWNSMSSQEVVDFVSKELEAGTTPLSRICEKMFDACLAADTRGDGTGCDNMTCIVVQFHPKNTCEEQRKRMASADSEEEEAGAPTKKTRSEDTADTKVASTT